MESLINGNEVISHDQLNLLTKIESVSRELKDIKTIFKVKFLFISILKHGDDLEKWFRSFLQKTIKHIIMEFENFDQLKRSARDQ